MKLVQLIGKFGLQMLPAVSASVLSAAVLGALQLAPGHTPQRGASETDDSTVYVDVMPRINRDPAPTVIASAPPAHVETPAVAASPVKAPTRPQATNAADRAARNAPTAPAATVATVAPKVEPVASIEPAPKAEPAAKVETVAMLAPPLPVAAAPMQIVSIPAEPRRVLGMPVPQPVSDVGGAVVDVAKMPIQFADTIVARPAWRVGERIVSSVVGWVVPSR